MCFVSSIGGKGVLSVFALLVGAFVVCISSSFEGRIIGLQLQVRLFIFIREVAPPSVRAASNIFFGHSRVVMGENCCQFTVVPFYSSGGRLEFVGHYFACSDVANCGCVCGQNRI